MGVVVAFSANVDSIHVLDALMGNPAVTAALVDPKNPTLFELKKVSERLTKLQSMAVTKDDLGKNTEGDRQWPAGENYNNRSYENCQKIECVDRADGRS